MSVPFVPDTFNSPLQSQDVPLDFMKVASACCNIVSNYSSYATMDQFQVLLGMSA